MSVSARRVLPSVLFLRTGAGPRIFLRSYARAHGRAPINGLSEVAGETDTRLLTQTLGSFWSDIVAKHGDRSALVSRHEPSSQHDSSNPTPVGQDCLRWTFRAMDEHVVALARGLLRAGIKYVSGSRLRCTLIPFGRRGDRVAVFSQNNSSYAALQWATAKVGAILTSERAP